VRQTPYIKRNDKNQTQLLTFMFKTKIIIFEPSISSEQAAWLLGTDVFSIERLARKKAIKSHRNKLTGEYRFFESDLRKSFGLNKYLSGV